MADWKVLPLGIDVGSTRARIALAEAHRSGSMRIRAIVARDLPGGATKALSIAEPELVAAVLEEMVAELGTRERRCVLALNARGGIVRTVVFPRMTWAERMRAARFEAQRFCGWDLEAERAVVRVHCSDRSTGSFVVGVARPDALHTRVASARKAGLRTIAVDHEAFALRRVFSDCDAIVDVGSEVSAIHVFSDRGQASVVVELGGSSITIGIARELSIDVATAERRKRILGCAGAGLEARCDIIREIGSAIERARSGSQIQRVVVTGNGSRIPNFTRELEQAAEVRAEMPVPELLRIEAYPEDVVRAASPDWALAASLATWKAAA
jgi:Tfp pilus assembly PilM family ATPase